MLLLITNIILNVDGIWPTITMFKVRQEAEQAFCPSSLPASSVYSEIHMLLFSTKQHGSSRSCEVTLYHSSPQSLRDTLQGTLYCAEKP